MNTIELRSQRKRLSDLSAFAVIAEERSFTRAAVKLGVTQSSLSHLVRQLESELGVRLLARTTRSVSPTAAGAVLLERLKPALGDIDHAIESVQLMRNESAGTVRITAFKLAAQMLIWPILPKFFSSNPGIQLDLNVSDQLVDIVAHRFDAGIRFETRVEKDMVGVRVGPPLHYITLASPGYLRRFGKPTDPSDLEKHRCLHFRLSGTGEVFPWQFKSKTRRSTQNLRGPVICNDSDSLLSAAISGMGLVQLYEGLAQSAIERGELVQVLNAWRPQPSHMMLYYPSQRQVPRPLKALIEALKSSPVTSR